MRFVILTPFRVFIMGSPQMVWLSLPHCSSDSNHLVNFTSIQLQWNISTWIFLQGNKGTLHKLTRKSSSILVLLVGSPVTLPRLFKRPQYLSTTPSGPGCPGSSPSFRTPTSQPVQAPSLGRVPSLQALSQGGTSTPWWGSNPSCSTPWRGTNV